MLSVSNFAMSNEREKGKISERVSYEIEWTIEDISSLRMPDESYDSPRFSLPGSKWYLSIYPNGETEENSIGWIGLYLMRGSDESTPPKRVNYNLGVKKVDGTVEVIKHSGDDEVGRVFAEKNAGRGLSHFLQRSELLLRKSELAPCGALTIICTMRVKDSWDCTLRLMNVSEKLKNMFLSEEGCDATLIVQESRKFPVNRSVLASQLPVFRTMFEADMKEKRTGVVDIVDCDPEAFKDFLVYIYSGQVEISSDSNIFELYRIADKYCAEELKLACVDTILNSVSLDNVVDVAMLGHQFVSENEFKSKSQEFFNKNFAVVVTTDKWISLLRRNPDLANELLTNMAKDTEVMVTKKY